MQKNNIQSKSFGDLIRKARNERGLTLEELGRLIDKPLSAVSDMEREKSIPVDMILLGKLSYHLRIDLEQLLLAVVMSKKFFNTTIENSTANEDYTGALIDGIFANQRESSADIVETKPRSLNDIETNANSFRSNHIDCDKTIVPIMDVYEKLSREPRYIIDSDTIQVTAKKFSLDQHESYVEGKTAYSPQENLLIIYLREDVWELARQGTPRARFTAAHELGHAVLHWRDLVNQGGTALFRDSTVVPSQSLAPGQKIYESPEWQANSWASALLMPRQAVESRLRELDELADPERDISKAFGVSLSAARYRLQKLYVQQSQKRQMTLF